MNYICMGIAVGVGFLNVLLKANIPGFYEEKKVIWWFVIAIYLGAVLWKEYGKVMYQWEEFA